LKKRDDSTHLKVKKKCREAFPKAEGKFEANSIGDGRATKKGKKSEHHGSGKKKESLSYEGTTWDGGGLEREQKQP